MIIPQTFVLLHKSNDIYKFHSLIIYFHPIFSLYLFHHIYYLFFSLSLLNLHPKIIYFVNIEHSHIRIIKFDTLII